MPPLTMQIEGKQLFENGYGISVISENNLGDEPLYEVAVLSHQGGKRVRMNYETELTNDVIRYCDANTVSSLIERVRNLPLSNPTYTKGG